MALTVATVGTRLLLPVKNGGADLTPPPVSPMPLSPPLDAPIPPNPVTAPPPTGQFRGEGGTTFAISSGIARPLVYVRPLIETLPKPVLYATPESGDFAPMAPVTPVPNIAPPAGTNANVKSPVLWVNTIDGRRQYAPYDVPPDKSPGWKRTGTATTLPVPTKPKDPAPALDPAGRDAQSGPITGKVAGFDLGRIPLWGWLIGAALIGARLLK